MTVASYIWDILSYNFILKCKTKKIIIICKKDDIIKMKDNTYKLNIPLIKTLPLIEYPEISDKKNLYIILQDDKKKYNLYSIDGTYMTSSSMKDFELEKFKVDSSLLKNFLNIRGKKLKMCRQKCPLLKKYPVIDDKIFSQKLKEIF